MFSIPRTPVTDHSRDEQTAANAPYAGRPAVLWVRKVGDGNSVECLLRDRELRTSPLSNCPFDWELTGCRET